MIDSQYTFRSRSLSDETGDDARPLYSSTDSNGTQVGNFIVSDFAIVYDFTVDEGTEYVEHIFSHSLRKTCNQRKLRRTNYRDAGGGGDMGGTCIQVLGYQLTLFGPREADYACHITSAPPSFWTMRRL